MRLTREQKITMKPTVHSESFRVCCLSCDHCSIHSVIGSLLIEAKAKMKQPLSLYLDYYDRKSNCYCVAFDVMAVD